MSALADAALASLRSALPGIDLRLRRNRRTLVSLRGRPGSLHLSLHPQVLADADHAEPIINWVARRGRGGAGARLRAVLARTQERIASDAAPRRWDEVARMTVVAGGVDLEATLGRILSCHFPDLSRPVIHWARRSTGRLATIRFGAYRRQSKPGSISMNPRLDRPWIAGVFIDHVIHHELCHHRQACEPLKSKETAHSPRFRAWERTFPAYRQARDWERAALPWLLDDRPPPWYSPC